MASTRVCCPGDHGFLSASRKIVNIDLGSCGFDFTMRRNWTQILCLGSGQLSRQGTGEKVQGRLRQPALYGPQYPLSVNWLIEIWLLASCVKAWNGPFTYSQPSQEGVMLLTTLPIKSQLLHKDMAFAPLCMKHHHKGIGEGPSLLLTCTGANGESPLLFKHALEAQQKVLHFFLT